MSKLPSTDENIGAVVQEIKEYLIIHPNAADGLEGIAKWWLSRGCYEQAVHRVERALEYLVAQGTVKKVITADGKTVYSSAARDSDQTH